HIGPEAEVGILVMAEHIVLGKPLETLEQAPVDRYERAADRRDLARPAEFPEVGRGALAVMLDPEHRQLADAPAADGDAPIHLEIEAGMHQGAVGIEERRAEDAG